MWSAFEEVCWTLLQVLKKQMFGVKITAKILRRIKYIHPLIWVLLYPVAVFLYLLTWWSSSLKQIYTAIIILTEVMLYHKQMWLFFHFWTLLSHTAHFGLFGDDIDPSTTIIPAKQHEIEPP